MESLPQMFQLQRVIFRLIFQLQLKVRHAVHKRCPLHIAPSQVQGGFCRSLHVVQTLPIANCEGVGVPDLVNLEVLRSREQANLDLLFHCVESGAIGIKHFVVEDYADRRRLVILRLGLGFWRGIVFRRPPATSQHTSV